MPGRYRINKFPLFWAATQWTSHSYFFIYVTITKTSTLLLLSCHSRGGHNLNIIESNLPGSFLINFNFPVVVVLKRLSNPPCLPSLGHIPFEGAWLFIWRNSNISHSRTICVKFNGNWPSDLSRMKMSTDDDHNDHIQSTPYKELEKDLLNQNWITVFNSSTPYYVIYYPWLKFIDHEIYKNLNVSSQQQRVWLYYVTIYSILRTIGTIIPSQIPSRYRCFLYPMLFRFQHQLGQGFGYYASSDTKPLQWNWQGWGEKGALHIILNIFSLQENNFCFNSKIMERRRRSHSVYSLPTRVQCIGSTLPSPLPFADTIKK